MLGVIRVDLCDQRSVKWPQKRFMPRLRGRKREWGFVKRPNAPLEEGVFSESFNKVSFLRRPKGYSGHVGEPCCV